jgi:hypothetical protein
MRLAKTFKPGDLVPASGVYAVVHSAPHSLTERQMYIKDATFPECRICSEEISYRLESPCVPFKLPSEAVLVPS